MAWRRKWYLRPPGRIDLTGRTVRVDAPAGSPAAVAPTNEAAAVYARSPIGDEATARAAPWRWRA